MEKISRLLSLLRVASARAVASVGLILLNFATAKFYGISAVGVVSILIALGLGLSVILRLGMDYRALRVVGIYYGEKNFDEIANYIWICFYRITFVTFLFSLLVAGLYFTYAFDYYLQLLLMGWVIALGATLGSVLRASAKTSLGQIFDIGGFSLVLSATLSGGFLFALDLGVIVNLAVLIFGIMVFGVVWNIYGNPQVYIRHAVTSLFSELRSLVPLYASSIVQYLIGWGGILITGYLLSNQDVAAISIAQRYAMVIFMIFNIAASIQAPKYSSYYSKGLPGLIIEQEKKLRYVLLAVCGPLLLLIIFFSDFLLEIFSAPPSSGIVLVLLCAANFLTALLGCSVHLLICLGMDRQYFNIYLIAGALGLPLVALLGYYDGLTGIAVGMCFLVLFPALSAFIITRRKLIASM